MRNWKKTSSAIIALTMMSGLTIGCGTGNHVAGNDTNTTGNTTTGAGGNVPSGQTITVWSWAGNNQLDEIRKITANWAKLHGDTVNVVDQSTNPKSFQFYSTAARTGKGPDVAIGIPHDNLGAFQQQGLLASMPSGIMNPSDYTKSVVNAVTVNGQAYALPVSVQTTALFYNTKKVPTPPKNWSSFVAAANQSGFAFDQGNLYFNYAFVGGMGGYVFKNNNGTLDPKDIGLANAGAVKGFQLLRDFNAKYHWMTPSMNGAIAKGKFTAGQTGMYISGPWDTADIKKSGIPYSISTLPALPNGKPATPFLGVITTFVNARSPQNKQVADWDLAKTLSDSSAEQQYFTAMQQIPAMTGAQQSKAVQGNPYFKAFADQTKVAVPMPNIPQMAAVWGAQGVIANIIKGSVTPQQGARDFVNNIKTGIQQLG